MSLKLHFIVLLIPMLLQIIISEPGTIIYIMSSDLSGWARHVIYNSWECARVYIPGEKQKVDY